MKAMELVILGDCEQGQLAQKGRPEAKPLEAKWLKQLIIISLRENRESRSHGD